MRRATARPCQVAAAIAPSVVPALFAVALVWGTVGGLLRLRGLIYAGDRAAVDASALFVGQPLYADPTRGYASSVYTPLLPVLGAALDHLRFWRSWVPLITFASSLAMVAVIARLVYDRSRGTVWGVAEAVGVGALCYWLVGELGRGYFWNDRPDQLSWALGIGGLLLVPTALRSNAAAAGALLLLSAAFWTKQTALVAAGAALVTAALAAARGEAGRRRVAVLTGVFLAGNGLLVALVDWLTGGWFMRIAFAWPARQPCCELGSTLPGYVKGFVVEFSVQYFFGALLFVAVAISAIVVATRSEGNRRGDLPAAVPLVAFTILALAAALVTRRRLGAAPSHELGLAWGLALLTALGYRFLRRSGPGTVVAALLVACLLAGSQLVGSRQLSGSNPDGYLSVPALEPKLDWNAVPTDLAVYARRHVVFAPDHGDVSVLAAHRAFPTWVDLTGFMYVGRMPDYLARDIMARRFDLVFPFSQDEVTHPLTSGNGVYEQNYLWKINRAIELEYRPSRSAPDGGRVPVAGPDPAPWLSRCFGPYVVARVALRQHVGGGFWCPSGSVLSLRETPAEFADVRTDAGTVSGSVRVRLVNPGRYVVAVQQGARIVWQRSQSTSGGRWATIVVPLTKRARLSLGATRGSGAAFDVTALRVRPTE